MELHLRPLKPKELQYAYPHTDPLMSAAGFIGVLRATLDNDGSAFRSDWEEHSVCLKVPALQAELETVLDMLRFDERYGHIFKNTSVMTAYGLSHPDSRIEQGLLVFGFRADSRNYTYMIRLEPDCLNNNVNCYCFSRDALERHMRRAAKGIRFMTTKGVELFTIADGDSVRISDEESGPDDYPCHYIAEGLVELRTGRYGYWRINELLDSVEEHGGTIIPLRSSLPEKCFGVDPETSRMVVITKGVHGTTPAGAVPIGVTPQEGVKSANDAMGITPAQAAAMLAGALHGWGKPEADPKNYDRLGKAIKPKSKDDFER